MAGLDLTSLLIAGAGIFALTKMGDSPAATIETGSNTSVRAATPDQINLLAAGGLDVEPTDVVQIIETTSPAGQPVSAVTVNYSAWDHSGQVIWADPDDQMRMQGWYVPYIDRDRVAAMARKYGGQNPDTYLQTVATNTSSLIDPDYTMKAKDWDFYRTHYNSGEQPLPLSAAEAEERISANRYWDLVQQKGGWISGVMLHYGDRARLSGVGSFRSSRLVDPRWY